MAGIGDPRKRTETDFRGENVIMTLAQLKALQRRVNRPRRTTDPARASVLRQTGRETEHHQTIRTPAQLLADGELLARLKREAGL